MDERLDNLFARQILAPLTIGFPYLPYTQASLSIVALAHILNDVVLNRRTQIIELGGGISTILLGRLAKVNKLDFRVTTIEHDEHWAKGLRDLLAAEGSSIEVAHAPLRPCELSPHKVEWYDLEVVERATAGKQFGPRDRRRPRPPRSSSGASSRATRRSPALRDKMAERFSFYLDDANRPGELTIIGKWSAAFGLRFDCSQRTFAFARVGSSQYCEPLIRA